MGNRRTEKRKAWRRERQVAARLRARYEQIVATWRITTNIKMLGSGQVVS
jgi:hypothetical protein